MKNEKNKMTLEKLAEMIERNMVTKDEFNSLTGQTQSFRKEVNVFREEVNGRFDAVDKRLDRIESKVDNLSELVDDHEKDILGLKHKVSILGRR